MKRLYLLRHSKAGQTNKKLLDDHERPLTDKGRELCTPVAQYLATQSPLPGLVLCSSSVRTRETAALVLEALGRNIPVEYVSRLYLATPEDIADVVRAVDNKVRAIMLIGHNPGLQQFAMELAGSGDKKKFREMRNNFPPASIAVLDLPKDDWFEARSQSATLIDFAVGKSLK